MELIVPTLGESITEATVSKWLKKVGDSFEADEPLVEIETDKITVEVPAPSAGSISEIKVEEGADVNIGGVLALLGDKKSTNGIIFIYSNWIKSGIIPLVLALEQNGYTKSDGKEI